ncbi:MAG TPA: hypothetical protein VGH09_06045 [Solirubrobacteraceae bacterium]|jgi:hypothetical protein
MSVLSRLYRLTGALLAVAVAVGCSASASSAHIIELRSNELGTIPVPTSAVFEESEAVTGGFAGGLEVELHKAGTTRGTLHGVCPGGFLATIENNNEVKDRIAVTGAYGAIAGESNCVAASSLHMAITSGFPWSYLFTAGSTAGKAKLTIASLHVVANGCEYKLAKPKNFGEFGNGSPPEGSFVEIIIEKTKLKLESTQPGCLEVMVLRAQNFELWPASTAERNLNSLVRMVYF